MFAEDKIQKGQKLKAKRKALEVRMVELGKIAGVSTATICRVERGTYAGDEAIYPALEAHLSNLATLRATYFMGILPSFVVVTA